ncbi:MAG: DUF1835 domain-containing protein [Gemmataceae bacterium]|nr:DUF1835 domain-containing protein [Gemmataceae bacterium]
MGFDPIERFSDPVHVVPGDSAGGSVHRPRCEVVVVRDSLVTGPSDLDPARHGAARRAWWRDSWLSWRRVTARERRCDEELLTDALSTTETARCLAAYPPERPVVLWTVALWSERLAFWWMLDLIEREGWPRERFWVVEVPIAWAGVGASLGSVPSNQFEAAFPGRVPLSARTLRSGSALWRKYAAPSPAAFDAARRRGVSSFADLGATAEPHGLFFPRIDGESRLRLARADQLLFDMLRPDAWVTPREIICHGRYFDEILPHAGDVFPAHRLYRWAAHRPDAPAIVAQELDGDNHLLGTAYGLTARGVRIRDEGLLHAEEAPPTWAGGCQTYVGKRPWVRIETGDGWRLVRHRSSTPSG